MLHLLTSKPKTIAFTAALALLATTVDSEGASGRMRIFCPTELTVDWIQAANGKTNTVRAKTLAIIFREPNPKVICKFDPANPPIVQQLVNLGPKTVASACQAKATVSGKGDSNGGVGPYGGFPFKSKRIQAVAAYNEATGICLLTLPTANLEFGLKMNQPCRSADNTGTSIDCPVGSMVVN